jgi:hypothetical protein
MLMQIVAAHALKGMEQVNYDSIVTRTLFDKRYTTAATSARQHIGTPATRRGARRAAKQFGIKKMMRIRANVYLSLVEKMIFAF